MTPTEILDDARTVLQLPAEGEGGLGGPTQTALLARQALEDALTEYWQRTEQGVDECPTVVQLVTLRFYVDSAIASSVGYAWAQLSHVCHYDGYQLPPTASEMEHLLDIVDDLITTTSA